MKHAEAWALNRVDDDGATGLCPGKASSKRQEPSSRRRQEHYGGQARENTNPKLQMGASGYSDCPRFALLRFNSLGKGVPPSPSKASGLLAGYASQRLFTLGWGAGRSKHANSNSQRNTKPQSPKSDRQVTYYALLRLFTAFYAWRWELEGRIGGAGWILYQTGAFQAGFCKGWQGLARLCKAIAGLLHVLCKAYASVCVLA